MAIAKQHISPAPSSILSPLARGGIRELKAGGDKNRILSGTNDLSIEHRVRTMIAGKQGASDMIEYAEKIVPIHTSPEASLFLLNEAPGDTENDSGIPCYGPQGGVIYRALIRHHVNWAKEFTGELELSWPIKTNIKQYNCKEGSKKRIQIQNRLNRRHSFLELRKKYISCSNSYPKWPQSSSRKYERPLKDDILSGFNLKRLAREMTRNHITLFICGKCAWLACMGAKLDETRSCGPFALEKEEIGFINQRFHADFTNAFYLCHTRFWNYKKYRPKVDEYLSVAFTQLGWISPLTSDY